MQVAVSSITANPSSPTASVVASVFFAAAVEELRLG
jgi:hypothetical protein